MQREFSKLSVENFDLLTRKGIYPYEYIASKSWRRCVYYCTNLFTVHWRV